jgi:hypothetical protein
MTDSFDIRNSAFGICPVPPKGNANFAWVQHFIHAGFNTLANLRDALLPKLLSGEVSPNTTS